MKYKITNTVSFAGLRTLCPQKKMRKDMRGTNYTYYISCFLILLLIKSRLGTFPL